MRLFSRLAIAAALVALAASPASAAGFANFQGNCTDIGSVVRCTFDAQRPASNPSSCAPSTVRWYSWNYGDGTGSGLTTNNQVTHDYDDSDRLLPAAHRHLLGRLHPEHNPAPLHPLGYRGLHSGRRRLELTS